MTTLADKAKAAAQARIALHDAMQACAARLMAASEALNVSCTELSQAAQQEVAATSSYIAALEAELSRQQQLS